MNAPAAVIHGRAGVGPVLPGGRLYFPDGRDTDIGGATSRGSHTLRFATLDGRAGRHVEGLLIREDSA